MSLTGDPITDAVIPAASALVWAVKTDDADQVEQAINDVLEEMGNLGLRALAVVLAAMVPDDRPPSDLLGWRDNPSEYLAHRERGVDSYTAMTLVRTHTTDAA